MRKGNDLETPLRAVIANLRDNDRVMERALTQDAIPAGSGTGTVTSAAITVPSILSVSGSPITTAGTFAVTLANQSANQVWAGPTGGGAAAPTFRSLVAADFPAGIVSSVALSLPAIFSVSGSPVTSSGTLTGTLANQTANYIWAGPVSGGAAAPTFRAMVAADVPNSLITYAKIQDMTTARLLGRTTAGSGVVEEISVGAGLTLTAGVLNTAGGAGVTGSGTANYVPAWSSSGVLTDSPYNQSGGILTNTTTDGGIRVTRTGTDALMYIQSSANLAYDGQITIGVSNATKAASLYLAAATETISVVGSMIWTNDATSDIGASGATRPRDAYLSRSLYAASLKLLGSSSGTATITPPAAAGTPTLTLPTSSGTLALTSDVTSKTLFAATADKTVANTTTETSIVGTGTGSATLAAGFWTAGKTVRIRAWGYASCSGGGKLRYRVKAGSVVILDTTAVDVTGIANARVLIQADITCRTTGGSGTVFAQGQSLLDDGTGLPFPASTSTVTVDTTASALLDVLATWQTADAGNTITITNVTIEALGS